MSDHEDEQGLYVTIAEAAKILHVGVRQVHNHLNAGRIQSRKQGRRRLLVATDVQRLAEVLDAEHREVHSTSPNTPVEYLPANVQQTQAELARVLVYTGQLEEQLKTRLTPEEADDLKRRLAETEGRAKALDEQLAHYRKPLWRRLLGV